MGLFSFGTDTSFHHRKPISGVPVPILLMILDGFGEAPTWGGNALSTANMPNMMNLMRTNPHSSLGASGEAVGLPPRTRGNSEAGHLNLGAGRIVEQDYSYITSLIQNQSFFENPALNGAINYAEQHKSKLHIFGLLSRGEVHSSADHLFALLELLKRRQTTVPILLHCFTDGRDSPPNSAFEIVVELEQHLVGLPSARIATLIGRYYAMDRDNRWDRTAQAWRAIALGQGQLVTDAKQALQSAYAQGITDEFLPPLVVANVKQAAGTVADNDAFIFYNFRPDRARQLTAAFTAPDFRRMQINHQFKNIQFVTFVRYEDRLPIIPAFHPAFPTEPLAAVLSMQGLRQFHIAETEKYAHVTYFFNGGREKPFPGEDRLLIPSPKVTTYDQSPAMSAPEITDAVLKRLHDENDDVIIMNFANPDMVGHTGSFSATIEALEILDQLIGQVVQAVWQKQGTVFITSDHGNAEEMINPHTGSPDTEHSLNPVPFLYLPANRALCWPLRPIGILADVAPTMLHLLRCPLGRDMTGTSLFVLRPALPPILTTEDQQAREALRAVQASATVPKPTTVPLPTN